MEEAVVDRRQNNGCVVNAMPSLPYEITGVFSWGRDVSQLCSLKL